MNKRSKLKNDREFLIHPYVPKDYDNTPLYLCIICANNWKDYRDKAEIENSLLLPDEVNEEICSFCSDLPTEIILCSKCPKSYCQACLKRVLSTAAFNKLLKDNDWKCMSCCSDNPLSHPLPRNAWKTFLHKDIDSMIQQGKIEYPSNKPEVVSRTPKNTRTNRSTSISKKPIDSSALPPVDIKYGHANYIELEVPNTGEITKRSIIPIACQSCLNMFEKCKLRGNLIAKDIIDEMLSKPIKRFPGQYNNQNMKVTGIFKKWETKHYKIDDESKELDMELDLTDSTISFFNKTEVSNESMVIESESSKFETTNTTITDSNGNNIIISPKREKNDKKIKRELRNTSNDINFSKDNQNIINGYENSAQVINYSLTDSDNIENSIHISNLSNSNDNISATDSDPNMEIVDIKSNTVNTNSNNSRESKTNIVESHIESKGESDEPETLCKTPKKGKWSIAEIEDLKNAYSIYGNNISSILNDTRFTALKIRAESGIQKKLDVYDAIKDGSLQVKSNESTQEQADSPTCEVQKII
eukprot:gene19190-25036_t